MDLTVDRINGFIRQKHYANNDRRFGQTIKSNIHCMKLWTKSFPVCYNDSVTRLHNLLRGRTETYTTSLLRDNLRRNCRYHDVAFSPILRRNLCPFLVPTEAIPFDYDLP